MSPYMTHSADYILFQSFMFRGYIRNNQKIVIALDSCSRSSFFNLLGPFWYYSIFELTALSNLI